MYRLLLSLAVLVCLTLSETLAASSGSCQNERNMAMLPDQTDRSAYYLCLYGRAERFLCPPGFKFDSRKPACVPKRNRVVRSPKRIIASHFKNEAW